MLPNICQNKFPHKDLLAISELSKADIETILNKAAQYHKRSNEDFSARFANKTQLNLFFENSTRTQASFTIAGQRLGFNIIDFQQKQSSLSKGESLRDTAYSLEAMGIDLVILRHNAAGAAHFFAQHLSCPVINAGDGQHEHPSQALLDALTILQYKGRITGLTITICGDILHSRVARSNILCLSKLGNNIRLLAPRSLLPSYAHKMGADIFHDAEKALEGSDVIMVLRLQKERMEGAFIASLAEYAYFYGISKEKIGAAKKDCMILHPGPINRGVEITSDVADGPQSFIKEQVKFGVAVRMAIMDLLVNNEQSARNANDLPSLFADN